MSAGESIRLEDIHLLSPGDGFKWDEKNGVIGKKLSKDIKRNEILYKEFL